MLDENPNGDALSLKAARLSSRAFDQTRFPQVSPTVFLNEDGDPLARVGVSQIIFSKGQFQAEKASLRAAEIEVTTFSLRMLNAQSDFLSNEATQKQAEARLSALTGGLRISGSPPAFQSTKPTAEAPEVILLMAQSASARSLVALERARRRPNFSVEAFVDQILNSGVRNQGATIGAGLSVPLGVRNGLGVEAAEAELAALQADVGATRTDVERETAQLRATIARQRALIPTLRELSAVAESRIENFEAQFLSGAVSLEEAVSILETFSRARNDLIIAEIEILQSEVEIARIQGQLLPGVN